MKKVKGKLNFKKLFVFEHRGFSLDSRNTSTYTHYTPFYKGNSRGVSTNGKALLGLARKEHLTLRITTLSTVFATELL